MPSPHLTFFCELDGPALTTLFDSFDLHELQELKAAVSLGIVDLTPERAEIVRRLNTANIPVIAWLLLPREEGYWFNMDNAPQAAARYEHFRTWTQQEGLRWAGVGLDVEPDIRQMEELGRRGMRLLPSMLMRSLDTSRLEQAQADYRELVMRIRSDGYRIDSYQFPIIAEERRGRSTFLRRFLGIVDLPVDREVWMLYSSPFRAPVGASGTPLGLALLGSYAQDAESVGVGITGGGVDLGVEVKGWNPRPLTWEEFARDLRLAWFHCQDIHIFSLEGCVRNGYLERLRKFDWDQPILLPEDGVQQVDIWRGWATSLLWFGSRFRWIALSALGVVVSIAGLRRWLRNRKR